MAAKRIPSKAVVVAPAAAQAPATRRAPSKKAAAAKAAPVKSVPAKSATTQQSKPRTPGRAKALTPAPLPAVPTSAPASQPSMVASSPSGSAAAVRPLPAAAAAPLAVRQQGAWGLWWLVVVTFGVYYYIWFQRVNEELVAITGESRDASCEWWSQLIPIFNLVALAKTASRVNRAHQALDSPARVSSFVTWFWATGWFASQTRYLQRRINVLHDIQVSRQRHSYAEPGTPAALTAAPPA